MTISTVILSNLLMSNGLGAVVEEVEDLYKRRYIECKHKNSV